MTFYDYYKKMCNISPAFSKWSRWAMYSMFAIAINEPAWRFMNYGFVEEKSSGKGLPLEEDDEDHRYSLQLYQHLLSQVNLRNKRILEIGCGRGGGASFISKYHDPDHVTGLDFSGKAIRFCRRNYKHERLSFQPGDAENLPFEDSSFDIVVNVESSHCYNSMKKFLSQAKRVLNHGGYLLITDFRDINHVGKFVRDINESGLRIISESDITENVFSALRINNDNKMKMISKVVPGFLLGLFKEFAGVEGSTIHRKFNENQTRYLSYVLQKDFS